ncbi:MAG: hypothetical protein Q9190_005030 [Brigantiaea leucoxantha]
MKKLITLNENETKLRLLLLDVTSYIETLRGAKPQLRFAGGWVRDKLMGIPSYDVDIAIDSTTGLEFGKYLQEYLQKRPEPRVRIATIEANPEKSKHLETATTRIYGLDLDFVNLRKETYSEYSRNPQMEFGTPEEDALRRDSTINAMFYNLQTSEVEDFTGRGFEDIGQKVIKTPLEPYETFKDDPLRVLRHIRFASRFDFRIDQKDQDAMRNQSIQDALKVKISRERIGIEIEKMLRGPHPCMAISHIDQLTLYDTIFTSPEHDQIGKPHVDKWEQVYNLLNSIVTQSSESELEDLLLKSSNTIRQTLIRDPEELYRSWLLSAFVPWARTPPVAPNPKKPNTKEPAGGIAARGGIRADNTIFKIIKNAIGSLDDIICTKDAATGDEKEKYLTRETQGMAIRHWGSNWRSSALFALLTQAMETEEGEFPRLMQGYATWLSSLDELGVLDAWQLKPIITGDTLAGKIQKKRGPWLARALEEIVIPWQLRHPTNDDQTAVVEEVIRRKTEIGL